MSEASASDGRIEFGTNVDAALRRWGGYREFPDGFAQVRRALAVMEPVLGPVDTCYGLASGTYVAVRLAQIPRLVALYANVGFVWVTPAALEFASNEGIDLVDALRRSGLDLHDGDERGKTIWNAQGRRDSHRAHSGQVHRLCPVCFLQWPGMVCPDCDVPLT